MNVINPELLSHTLQVIPRFYPTDELVLTLYNEATQVENTPSVIYLINNGVMSFSFDFTFAEGDRYQFKISESNNIVYRGKLIATTQETQNYLTDKNEYYYE